MSSLALGLLIVGAGLRSCTAVPAASNSYLLARQLGGDAPLMAQILTNWTILAAVTLPIAISLVS